MESSGSDQKLVRRPQCSGVTAGLGLAGFNRQMSGIFRAGDCACQPCQVKRACLQKVMTLLARTSPALFELVEIWALP